MHPKLVIISICTLCLLLACRKKNGPGSQVGSGISGNLLKFPAETYNPLEIRFHFMFGNDSLKTDKSFLTANGDSCSLTQMKFLLTHIRADGQLCSDRAPSLTSPAFTFSIALSSSTVKNLSFTLGVDSFQSASLQPFGVLSHQGDMYAGVDTGYINVKLEGQYINGPYRKPLVYHIGGCTQPYQTQKEFVFNLNTPAVTGEGRRPVIHLVVDAGEFFKSPNLIDVKTAEKCLGPGESAFKFAENYSDMIKFDHVDP